MDTIRDHFTPIQLLCSRVPRKWFEVYYGILLPKPSEHEDQNRPPTSHELLTTVSFMRGYMSAIGVPDCSRSARLILKDVVVGKLKWVAAPPGISQSAFDEWTYPEKELQVNKMNETTGAGKNLLNQVILINFSIFFKF